MGVRLLVRSAALLFTLAAAHCTAAAPLPVPAACAASAAGHPACGPGLVGYSCAGSARPDENAEFADGVPEGFVCTDAGKVENDREGYCCTQSLTPCAYDPVAGCAAPTYGYECRGSDRPEAFDPTLFCGEGLAKDDLIVYCCGSAPSTQGCSQIAGHLCPNTLVGWTCHDRSLPSEVELGENQSRSDFNLLVCGIPTIVSSATGTVRQYCCYTPTSLPAGGSCLEDTSVPGCPADSFGFACSGTDTPDQDFPRIHCTAPATRGSSPQGYAAALFCCQFI
jgi:hypothetical protein